MKFYTFLTAFLVSFFNIAQERIEFYQVPKEKTHELSDLADYLTSEATSDSAKAARIYQWITHNIAYDYAALESGKELKFQTAEDVLKSKKAVCQGYSALMVGLMQKAGMQAVTVEGYASDYLSDTLIYLVQTNHEWVMFQAEGKWYMCDPTWDAGYIGRIPKYRADLLKVDKIRKKREAKLERSTSAKKDARLTKRFDKRDKAEAKKEVRMRGKFGGKVGFVRYPQMEYFMSPSDTFVQSHLASIEELQLRENPIRMEDFTKKTKSWDTILERKPATALDYRTYATNYATKKLQNQWLDRANKGFEFNNLNYLGKMLYYYDYVGVHLDEKFRESVGISVSSLSSDMRELRSMNDSVLSYVKPAKQVSKQAYSASRKQHGELAKQFKASDKEANSLTGKLLAAQEANLEVLKDESSRIKADVETIQKKMANLNFDERIIPLEAAFKDSYVPANYLSWADSLQQTEMLIDSLRANWRALVESEEITTVRFNTLENALNSSYYNLAILNSAATCYHDTVVKYDTIIAQDLALLISYHKEIFGQMLYPKEILKAYKNLEQLAKNGMSRLKKYEAKNAAYSSQELSVYLISLQHRMLKDIIADYMSYANWRSSLLSYEKQFVPYYKDIQENMKDEKKVKVENIDYAMKLLEKDQERTLKIIESIKKSATELELFFEKKFGN